MSKKSANLKTPDRDDMSLSNRSHLKH